MRAIYLPSFVLCLLVLFTSCENLEGKLQEKVDMINAKAESLDSLMNNELKKVDSLDSLINQKLDKVDSLDSMIDRELDKVNSLDSLVNSSSSKVDSMVKSKMDRINRIIN